MALTDGLISYYKMDTGSGTTAFDSVWTNDWTLIENPIWTTGKINDWLNFTKVENQRIDLWTQIPVDFTDSDFSIWFWFEPNSLSDDQAYYTAYGRDFSFEYRDSISSFRASFYDWSNSHPVTYQTTTTWVWYYFVFTRSKTSGTVLYVNWINEWTNSYTGNWNESFSSSQYDTTRIGSREGWRERRADWLLDELWIWNRALTQAEVTELYNNWDGLQYWTWTFIGPTTKRPWNIFFWFWAWAPEPVPTLIAYYTMDTWSWTTLFDSVGSNDWSINGATWTTGKIGDWLSFDWVNDYVNLGSGLGNFGSNSFSISLWVNLYVDSVRNSFISKWIINPGDFLFYQNTNGTIAVYIDGWAISLATSEYSINTWHLVTFTYDDSTASLYIDAELKNTSTWTSNINNTHNWIIWAAEDWTDRFMNWIIDEVWIWDQALTQEQITYLYNNWDWARPPFS